jgi:hypothetical protein
MMVWRHRETGPVHPSIRSAPSTGTFGMSRSVTTFMAFPPRVDRFRLSEIRASARHVILHTTERVESPGNRVGSCRHCERSGAISIALCTGTEIAAPAPGLTLGVVPLVTLNPAAVSCLVIPAQAGNQDRGADQQRLGSGPRFREGRHFAGMTTPLMRGDTTSVLSRAGRPLPAGGNSQ